MSDWGAAIFGTPLSELVDRRLCNPELPHRRVPLRDFDMKILFAMLCFASFACAAQDFVDVPYTVFGPEHTSQLTVESNVPDIAKLEAKAVDILRTKSGLTLAEARAKVRIDGKTDVARCLEYVIMDALQKITQAEVVGITVANQHPQ